MGVIVHTFLHFILERCQSSYLMIIFSKAGEKIISQPERGVSVRELRRMEICNSHSSESGEMHQPEKCRIVPLHGGLF